MRLAPQVGEVMINANRNLAAYESMGASVWPDPVADYPGPLAGWLAGLEHCSTPYMLTVPCDTPGFPADLAARLAQALVAEGAQIAMAATREDGRVQVQPVFCLVDSMLLESLMAYLNSGERKIDLWTAQHRCATVVFDDAGAFFNVNTLADLHSLEADPG
jgi:molybdopterin-guanine dinucleotide biosynthesis protein A